VGNIELVQIVTKYDTKIVCPQAYFHLNPIRGKMELVAKEDDLFFG
jgi:hypothetical protein